MAKACNTIRLYPWELESMDEYSTSLPTGQTMWKQWRCRRRTGKRDPMTGYPELSSTEWLVGQYVPTWRPGRIGIRWSAIVLRHGPKPAYYAPPEWDRFSYYRRGGFDHGIGYERVGEA